MAHNEAVLRTGDRLYAGQYLTSENGAYIGLMQEDGNFVIYRGRSCLTKSPGYDKTILWAAIPIEKAPGPREGWCLTMQDDGNLCIYSQNPWSVWNVAAEVSKNMGAGRSAVLYPDGRFSVCTDPKNWNSRIWATDRTDQVDGDSLELERIEYLKEKAKLSPPGDSRRESIGATMDNNGSLAQPIDVSASYTDTQSSSWKFAQSLKVGTKATLKAGIPGIGEGTFEVSAESTTTVEWNKVNTTSKTLSFKQTVMTPPYRSMRARVTWMDTTISVPFRVSGKMKFASFPHKLPVQFEGSYEGVTTHDIHCSWKEMPLGGGAMGGAQEPSAIEDDGWHEVTPATWEVVEQDDGLQEPTPAVLEVVER